jgi:hypothetical protein
VNLSELPKGDPTPRGTRRHASLVASGIEFADLLPLVDGAGGIILLRHDYDAATLDSKNGLEYVTPGELGTLAAQDDVYSYGDFVGVDAHGGVSGSRPTGHCSWARRCRTSAHRPRDSRCARVPVAAIASTRTTDYGVADRLQERGFTEAGRAVYRGVPLAYFEYILPGGPRLTLDRPAFSRKTRAPRVRRRPREEGRLT